jgi:hypothetical protein
MFAFAIWDANARTLFCARDRLGIKPFYYYWDGKTFAFASEIKALLQHPAISAVFDDSLLPEYLAFGYTSDERTLFSGIRKLMPGHRLTLTAGNLRIDRYWNLPCQQSSDARDDASWIAECRRRLEETVEMRLMSDVPLGMFLSGGIDSSAIAALMARMVPGPVKTFSVGYREAEFSELGYAASVAKAIGTDHHEVVIGREEFLGALPKLIWHEDEPIVWPSSVSLYFVSKLAAERVKVVLTGEGADEMFGGYGRYRSYVDNHKWMDRYAYVPEAVRTWVRSTVGDSDLLSADARRRLGHTVFGREPSLESFYLDNFYSAFTHAAAREGLFRFTKPVLVISRAVERRAKRKSAGAAPVRGSEDVPRRAPDETGSDEYGQLHRKPGSVPGSSVRGICLHRARPAQDPGTRRKVHLEAGGGGSASGGDHHPQEDGVPNARARVAPRRARRPDARGVRRSQRVAGTVSEPSGVEQTDRAAPGRADRRHRSHLAALQSPDMGTNLSLRPVGGGGTGVR